MIAMNMAVYPHRRLKGFIHRRKDCEKINRPIQADQKRIIGWIACIQTDRCLYVAVPVPPILNCILREELTKPTNFYYFKTLERYPRQFMVDRACVSGKLSLFDWSYGNCISAKREKYPSCRTSYFWMTSTCSPL